MELIRFTRPPDQIQSDLSRSVAARPSIRLAGWQQERASGSKSRFTFLFLKRQIGPTKQSSRVKSNKRATLGGRDVELPGCKSTWAGKKREGEILRADPVSIRT